MFRPHHREAHTEGVDAEDRALLPRRCHELRGEGHPEGRDLLKGAASQEHKGASEAALVLDERARDRVEQEGAQPPPVGGAPPRRVVPGRGGHDPGFDKGRDATGGGEKVTERAFVVKPAGPRRELRPECEKVPGAHETMLGEHVAEQRAFGGPQKEDGAPPDQACGHPRDTGAVVLLEAVQAVEHDDELIVLGVHPLAGQQVVDDGEDVGLGRGGELRQVQEDGPARAGAEAVGGLHSGRGGTMARVAAEEGKVAAGKVGDERGDEPGALHPGPLRDRDRQGPNGEPGDEQVAQVLPGQGGAGGGLWHGVPLLRSINIHEERYVCQRPERTAIRGNPIQIDAADSIAVFIH